MSAPSSATLYRWRERLLAVGQVIVPGTDVHDRLRETFRVASQILEANEELEEVAEEIFEAYIDALRRETAEVAA